MFLKVAFLTYELIFLAARILDSLAEFSARLGESRFWYIDTDFG